MRKSVHILFFLFVGLTLSACGGGGGGGDSDSGGGGSLSGTWLGTLEDPSGGLHSLQVTVDGDTATVLVDGVSDGLTYTIRREQSGIYSVTASDGTVGGFYVDSRSEHLVYVDEDFAFAVIEKGASSIPSFANADLVGSWSGFTVLLDGSFEISDTFSSSATVNGDGTFSGSDAFGTFSGALGNAQAFGRWIGGFSNSSGENGEVRIFMTPDKQFAGTWACSGPFPTECSFSAWRN